MNVPLFSRKRQDRKKRREKNAKNNVLYLYVPTFLLSMLAFVESPGSPAPFSTSTSVLPAVLPRQVVITLTSLRTDESEYHIISVFDSGYDSYVFFETEIEKRRVF